MKKRSVGCRTPRRLAVVLLLLLSLAGCSSRFMPVEVSDVPLETARSGDPSEDVEAIVDATRLLIQPDLPDAYLTDLGFKGDCQALRQQQVSIQLVYAQIRWRLWRRQVLVGIISIDTARATADYRTEDWSDYYMNLDEVGREDVRQIPFVIERTALLTEEQGIRDCFATAFRRSSDEWGITLTEAGTGSLGPMVYSGTLRLSTGEVIPYDSSPGE